MSSQKFSSELEPQSRLRFLVRATGLLAGCAGIPVILGMPFGPLVRGALVLAWLVRVAVDVGRLILAQRDCLGIRIFPGGTAQIVTAGHCCIAATIMPGSVVTKRFAWLRLDADNGRRYRELVRGSCPQNDDWRRFQVIWRHLGAGP